MRLGEVWLSPPCNTFFKLGVINKEHQFRDKEDPLRKPIQGTKKGEYIAVPDAEVPERYWLHGTPPTTYKCILELDALPGA